MVLIRYTYEVSPVFTLMEDAVLRKLIQIIGWEEGGDGLFNAGIYYSTLAIRLLWNIKPYFIVKVFAPP